MDSRRERENELLKAMPILVDETLEELRSDLEGEQVLWWKQRQEVVVDDFKGQIGEVSAVFESVDWQRELNVQLKLMSSYVS